ncbi:MAG: pseudouridine synthase [Thermoprotei archaeon]|nr:MAG: pseudouridine synthase [Thermoprotei archaeon]
MRVKASSHFLLKLAALIDAQFSTGASRILEKFKDIYVIISPSTGRPRMIINGEGNRLFSIRASDFRLIPTLYTAKLLKDIVEYPRLRVVVCNEVSEFIAKGGNVFARHVLIVDDNIRAGDEVMIINEYDELLAIGRAKLSATEMLFFTRGVAVITRESVMSNA